VDKAYIGLLGVFVGAFLTLIKDWSFERRSRRKNAEFLSIHSVCMLDHFVSACVVVVQDDGLDCGQYDSDNCRSPQVTLPNFKPQSVEVEWKSLPAPLMYEILSFPNEIEESNAQIDAVYEYKAGPPDYEEFFDERSTNTPFWDLKPQNWHLGYKSLEQSPPKDLLTGTRLRF
jgi:hypothetical protein